MKWTLCYGCMHEERPDILTAEEIEEALRKSREDDLFAGESDDTFYRIKSGK